MPKSSVSVRTGNLDEVIKIASTIPEFIDPYKKLDYTQRLRDKKHLILIAEYAGKLAGFKLGYALDSSVFY